MIDINGKYAFITAYLKGEEAKLVTPVHIDRLLRARDIPEVIEIIRDTDIGKYLDSVLITDFDEADRALWLYLDDCLHRMQWLNETPAAMQQIIDAYLVKYDVLNVKAALESTISGKKTSFIPLGTLCRRGWLVELGNVQDVNGIITVLSSCGLVDMARIFGDDKSGGKLQDKLKVATLLDRHYYENLFKLVRRITDREELIKSFGMMMDIRNLKMLMRGVARGRVEDAANATVGGGYAVTTNKIQELASSRLEEFPARVPYEYKKLADEVIASYGRNANITAVDDIADRYEFKMLHDTLSLKLMSPVMIVWYLILKETEIRNLRMVLRAFYDNVPLEEIKDHLVVTV